jgi:iron-sulfur cluster repair protein YtfE (RIC family)
MASTRSTTKRRGAASTRGSSRGRTSRRAQASRGDGNGRSSASRLFGGSNSDLKQIIGMLTDDHDTVDRLFKKIEKLKKVEDDSRYDLLQEACSALTVHAAIEEQLFYPAAREAGAEMEEELVDESEVEHEHIKELVQQLKDMSEDDPLCDAKAKVLSEYVRHHVKEEETKLFPRLKKDNPDFSGLYEQMLDLRQELEQNEMGVSSAAVARSTRSQTSARAR